jgi:hypothetical protein
LENLKSFFSKCVFLRKLKSDVFKKLKERTNQYSKRKEIDEIIKKKIVQKPTKKESF